MICDAAMALRALLLLLVRPRVDEGGAAGPSLWQVVVGIPSEVDGEGIESEDEVDLSTLES